MRESSWQELLRRAGELRDLTGVLGVLTWDQEVCLPKGGNDARAAQAAAIQAIQHERLCDPRLGELLSEPGDTEHQRTVIRLLTRERDRATKLPERLVRALAEAQGKAVHAWRQARSDDDFPAFEPHLTGLLALRREQADALGHEGERYDALLENFEPGMKTSRLAPILEDLERRLVPLVQAVAASPAPAGRFEPAGGFSEDGQWKLTLELLSAIGFDLDRGRQDKSTHPFTDGIHPTDVRVTTRLTEAQPFTAIFGTLHEGGHGLYEQGLPLAHARDPIGLATSMGLHESQSRLWENVIGRSHAFWERWLPRAAELLPALRGVSVDAFYAAINRVERGWCRVEADELTYNLHILVRFRLERAMLSGALQVAELPGAWNDAYERTVGLRPKNDREGCLQDIHWAWGELGYFPTYTLGNLYAASIAEALDRALGGLDGVIRRGELTKIRDWLNAHVHVHGQGRPAEQIVTEATGKGLDAGAFVQALAKKYGALYGITLRA